jgi:hypothetical protein
VYDNVAMIHENAKLSGSSRRQEVLEAIDFVGLDIDPTARVGRLGAGQAPHGRSRAGGRRQAQAGAARRAGGGAARRARVPRRPRVRNAVTREEQTAELELIVETAAEVWLA